MNIMPKGFDKKPADIRKEMVDVKRRRNETKMVNLKQNKLMPQELFRMNQNIKRGKK